MSQESTELPLGTLFNSINYYSNDDLIKFLDTLSTQQAMYIINQAINQSYEKGTYSLQESEFLSKSLRMINDAIFYKNEQNKSE